MSYNSRVIKSGVWYTAANFLMKSIVFITTPIFTRMLTHHEFGLYNNFTSWMNTLSVFVTLNLESTFITAKYDYSDNFDEYIFSVLSLSSISSLFWLIILIFFQDKASEVTNVNSVYLFGAVLYLMAISAVNLFLAKERYAYKYKVSVFISLLNAIMTTVISIILVYFMKNRLTGRILGTIVPSIIIGGFLYVKVAKAGKKIKLEYWKYALPICLPFIPHLLSLTLLNSMDRIMITKMCGAEANGLYSLAYTCGAIITLLMSSLNAAFSPWLGDKLNSNHIAEIQDVSKKYVALFAGLAAGIMLAAPEILLIMGGLSYKDAIYVMPPVAFGCVCQFLYTMYVNIEQFKKKTVGMALASCSAAILNFVLNLIFIPQFGYIAAAYTTLVSYSWLLLSHMIMVRRLGFLHVYSVKFILSVLVFMCIYTFLISYLYNFLIGRYCLLIAYIIFILVIGFKHKSEIIKILKG